MRIARKKRVLRHVFKRNCATCGAPFETTNNTAKNCEDHRYKKSEVNRQHQIRYFLKNKYGITIEQYDELLEKQSGCCAVCKKSAESFKRRLAVDHNHVTGEVRGLLCTYCNHRIIGRHKTSDLFHAAAKYLDDGHTGWFVPNTKPAKKLRKSRVKKDRKEDYATGSGVIEILIDETKV